MNIGLLALSGIRVVDAELLRLGLTLPGFVERSKTIASLPSLGLLTLAALTPERHSVRYLEVPDPGSLPSLPDGFDLVALSSYSAQIREAYALADRYREAGVPVVMGGPHVTALPREALEHCDAVVAGEGEPVWRDVVADAEQGRMAGLYDARSLEYDLSDAPVPAYELLDVDRYNRLTVQASRGCPHRCEFCASSVLLTDRYKQKPVRNVVREIDRIFELWEHPFIEFADDNAMVNRDWWRELLRALRHRKFRWFAETDLSLARDPALLDQMRESGCAQVLIGLESPVEESLAGLELRADWKRKRFREYADAVREIQSHGITVNGCFVIGLDGQGPEIFDEVFEFVREVELYEVQVTVLTAFPGTPLQDRLTRENRVLVPGAWERCTLFDVNYRPTDMSPEQLAEGFRQLVVRLYGEAFTRWRRERFRETMRAGARKREEWQ
jgi:radical SAM superfamily enzyme YgiQ (UPF0313 family)